MIQSKVIDIIKSFNKKEVLDFEKYLNSPFLNSNKNLIKLYSNLKRFYPTFESAKLTKESIFKSVYQADTYNDSKLRKLLSDLYKEAEKFLVVSVIDKNELVFNKLLLDEFEIRKLDNLFLPKFEQHNTYLDNNKLSYDYFLEKHLAEWKNVMFHLERGMQHKITMNIYKRTEYIIFYFLSDFFLSLQDNLSNKNRFNTKSEVDLGNEFLKNFNISALFEYILKNDFEDKDILNASYLSFLAFTNFSDEKYYKEFKKFVLKHINNFGEGTQRAVVIHLINYCVRKKKLSKDISIRLELNDNYRLYIEYRLYKLSGENYFRSDIFLNVMSNYFEVGNITDASEFLDNNIEIIQPSHRKNIKALCSSMIEFEKGNFGLSLRQSSLIKTNTFLYKYKIKYLSLKNHFELKNYDIAKEAVNSFRRYVNGDENLSDIQMKKTLEFLNYYTMLWKFYENSPKEKFIEKTITSIRENSPIPEADWLVNKFTELIKN